MHLPIRCLTLCNSWGSGCSCDNTENNAFFLYTWFHHNISICFSFVDCRQASLAQRLLILRSHAVDHSLELFCWNWHHLDGCIYAYLYQLIVYYTVPVVPSQMCSHMPQFIPIPSSIIIITDSGFLTVHWEHLFFLCIIVASCIWGCTDTSCSQMMVLSPFRNFY